MKQHLAVLLVAGSLVLLAGCETTNSIPYKASTTNILAIQQSLGAGSKKVSVGTIAAAPGVDENLTCRLMGPVKVAPGKTLPQYIKEAFMEELFTAKAYDMNAPSVIEGVLKS
jgi:hypothetical protein